MNNQMSKLEKLIHASVLYRLPWMTTKIQTIHLIYKGLKTNLYLDNNDLNKPIMLNHDNIETSPFKLTKEEAIETILEDCSNTINRYQDYKQEILRLQAYDKL